MFLLGLVILIVGIFLVCIKIKELPILKGIGAGVMALSIVLMIFGCITIVPAGSVGLVDIFGKVNDQCLQPGLNLANPFANIKIMDTQTQEDKEIMQVPSKEGLTMQIDISALYRLSPEKAVTIYKTIGIDYDEVVVKPQFRSAVREATVFHEAKDLYTSGRDEISNKIFKDLEKMLAERGVILEKILLRGMALPDTVSGAIEQKLKAEQESEQMKFVLTKETQEAERKVIEAKGIAEAQGIINKTLTNQYLQHEAIKAQMALADSPNHTTVYIPSGDNGIPLVRTIDNK